MLTGHCFRCGNPGHWAKDCLRLLADSPPKPPPPVHCPCGCGPCLIMVARTPKNPGRKFYKCPAAQDCGFFKWCDKVTDDQIRFQPAFVHPICPCGAGPCRRETVKAGPDIGRSYFLCSIKQNFGACGFFQWEDAQITSEPEEARSSSPCTTLIGISDFGSVDENLPREADLDHEEENKVNRKVGETQYISSSKFEKGYPVSVVLNGILEEETGTLHSRFESVDPVCSLMLRSGVYWQLVCRNKMYAAEDSMIQGNQAVGFCVNGWLGRLAFPPFPCLKVTSLVPVLCCLFPSFKQIAPCEDAVRTVTEEQVLPSLSPGDVEAEEPSVKGVCGDQPMKGALLESTNTEGYVLEGDGVTSVLSSMYPAEQEMVSLRENTSYLVPSGPLVKHEASPRVLRCESSSDERGKSLENGPPYLVDLIEQYDREKVHFDSVSMRHRKIVSELTGSYRQLESLKEKAGRVRKLLVETEKRLACCKAETLEFAARYEEVWGELAESQKQMQSAAEKLAKGVEYFKRREFD